MHCAPLVFGLSLVLAHGLFAQEFVAPAPEPEDIIIEDRISKPTIEGIVKDVFENRKPWQMINPLAPAEYGSGERKVSKDFGPGTPFKSTGWIVAGVEW